MTKIPIVEKNKTEEVSIYDKYDKDQLQLIKDTVCKGATNNELKLFLYAAKKSGLDPLTRQIYSIARRSKNKKTGQWETHRTIQTGIDGYRLIADRTGQYAGSDDAIFDNEKTPNKATVTIYKMISGQRCPYTASARWYEYFPGEKQGGMWSKMPCTMLAKCAEALALRKAFPAELSGVYTNEEMYQADKEEPNKKITASQRINLFNILKENKKGWTKEDIKSFIKKEFSIDSTEELLLNDYNYLCDLIQNYPPVKQELPIKTTSHVVQGDKEEEKQTTTNELPW